MDQMLSALAGLWIVACAGCNGPGVPPPPCYGPDNGQGTVDLPPSCGLGPIGPINQPIITNGLNPGDSIILLDVNLLNLTPGSIVPGGSLGGDTQHSQGNLDVHLRGTGTLNGWDLHVPIRVDVQIDASGRPYFATQQSFNAQIQSLGGGITAPTPDFSQLAITAGQAFGLPSPGHVNLTMQPNGTYNIDSYFDVTYRIQYVGANGGRLSGRSGVQTTMQHLQIGQPASTGGTWTEQGDAPDLVPGQLTQGTGTLSVINGSISSPNDVDMFAIQITDPASFSATTVGGAGFDTQLFLFDTDGFGITHNDDTPAGGSTQSRITGQFVPRPGCYMLAISGYNRDPADAQGLPIWNDQPFNSERSPDGPSAQVPLAQWFGGGATGAYSIQLTGCQFCSCLPPRIMTQPAWQPVTLGGQATFSVAATGTGPLAYQWYHAGQSISGATTPTLVRSNVQDQDHGPYYVVVTGPCGTITSHSQDLTVFPIGTPPQADVGNCYVPSVWKQSPVPWDRLPNPAVVPNRFKIDMLIDMMSVGYYDIVVDFNACITTDDVNFLEGINPTETNVQDVFKAITSVAMTHCSSGDIAAIAAMPNMAMLEKDVTFEPALATSLQSITITAGANSPSTVADAYPFINGAGYNIAIVDGGVDDGGPGSIGMGHLTFAGGTAASAYVAGYNAITKKEVNPDDDISAVSSKFSHGTHVASIALGRGGGGVPRGVAPAAGLIDVKVFGSMGVCDVHALIRAVQKLIQKQHDWNVHVINMSVDGPDHSNGVESLSQVCNRAVENGMIVVAACKNYGTPVINPPARAAKVIAVGASLDLGTPTRPDDVIAPYSPGGYPGIPGGPASDDHSGDPYSRLKPEVVAPGGHTSDLGAGGIFGAVANATSGGIAQHGTSEASPMVAGLAALALQQKGGKLNPESFRAALLKSSERRGTPHPYGVGLLPAGWNEQWGWGLVNGYALLDALADHSADIGFGDQPVYNAFANTNIGPVNPPRYNVPNDIYVYVKNRGPNTARNVRVAVGVYPYTSSNPPFIYLGTLVIDQLNAGATTYLTFPWTPDPGLGGRPHQCLSAEIGYSADTTPGNNLARRNLEIAHSPVYFEARNYVTHGPLTINFAPTFQHPADGWDVQITPPSVTLGPDDPPVMIEALPLPPPDAVNGQQELIHIAAVAANPGAPWPAGVLVLGGASVLATMRDCNTNGIDDWFDIRDGTSIDADTNSIPDECQPMCERCAGDTDGNSIVESIDIPSFVACFVAGPLTQSCACADFNGDRVLDMSDVNAMVVRLLNADGSSLVCP